MSQGINDRRPCAGQDAVLDAQDESFIRIFDEFWRMHVMQAVFDAPNLEDQDDGDDWDDPFMEDDEEGYGYMDDAFNVMDELDDEAAMEFMDQPFYDDGMDVPFGALARLRVQQPIPPYYGPLCL